MELKHRPWILFIFLELGSEFVYKTVLSAHCRLCLLGMKVRCVQIEIGLIKAWVLMALCAPTTISSGSSGFLKFPDATTFVSLTTLNDIPGHYFLHQGDITKG